MISLAERLKNLELNPPTEPSSEEWVKRRERSAAEYNTTKGNLTGYDCPLCNNKGNIMHVENDGREYVARCACLSTRAALRRIEKSGLGPLLGDCTFDNFMAKSPWQKQVKATAQKFTKADPQVSWLFFGGQVGAGKTHLCTAAVAEYLRRGKHVKYMLWRDESVSLKATVNDDEAYAREINPLKKVEVLYIDDFFKTEQGKTPTTADINLAFEILNYRYNNRELITIISSEHTVDDLIAFDEAVGSRILQRSEGYCCVIEEGQGRNHRLKGVL